MHKLAIVSTVVWFIFTAGMLLWNWQWLPPQVPLWYNMPWGSEQLASTWMMWVVSGANLLFGLVIAWLVRRWSNEPLIAQMTGLMLLVVQIIIGLAMIRIVWLMA